jgi:hypothetical protein
VPRHHRLTSRKRRYHTADAPVKKPVIVKVRITPTRHAEFWMKTFFHILRHRRGGWGGGGGGSTVSRHPRTRTLCTRWSRIRALDDNSAQYSIATGTQVDLAARRSPIEALRHARINHPPRSAEGIDHHFRPTVSGRPNDVHV